MTATIHTSSETYSISKARSDQSVLLGDGEYCTLRRDVALDIGSHPGEQIRLFPDGDDGRCAVFTVHEIHDDGKEIRIAKKGRERLALAPSATVRTTTTIPVSGLKRMDVFEQNDVAETVWDNADQDTLLVCAPHDGMESNTAQAAGIVRKRLGAERASAWFAHAYGPDAFKRFHITSANISPASWPGLASVEREYEYCLSFHVHNGDDVLVGGLAEKTLRDHLGERISEAINGKRHVETDHSEMKYPGKTPENIVNRLATDESGIQIEMPPLIAHRYRKRVARAVSDFLDDEITE